MPEHMIASLKMLDELRQLYSERKEAEALRAETSGMLRNLDDQLFELNEKIVSLVRDIAKSVMPPDDAAESMKPRFGPPAA